MTTTEKIAATYLRLNGFLLLPLFTVFDGDQHNHLDLLGVRSPGSKEEVNNKAFLTDDKLFEGLEKLGAKPKEKLTGIVSEVKTGKVKGAITAGHIAYAARFLSTDVVYPAWFYKISAQSPFVADNHLQISLPYAIDWIISRFDWMEREENKTALTKSGSWTWSEEFLADLLVLRSLGVLKRLPTT